jgi:hypothetical protein
MSSEFELFEGTSFSDLMRDVYHNSKKKSRQIDSLIQELRPMIKNVGDATVMVPLIKDYLEVSVKNDDALVKLAAIVQRIVSASSNADDGNEFGMTDEERRRLLEEAEEEIKSIQETTKPQTQSKKIEDKDGDVYS